MFLQRNLLTHFYHPLHTLHLLSYRGAVAWRLSESRHFLCGSSHAMLWAELCLWLAQGPLLAPTLAPKLFQDHLPQRPLHPCSKQEDRKLNAAATHTWSRTISAFLLCLHSSSPYNPLSCLRPFWQAWPLVYAASTSWARKRCHVTPAKKHTQLNLLQRQTKTRSGAKRVQAKQQNDTEMEWDKERKSFTKMCKSKKYVMVSTLTRESSHATPRRHLH